MNNKPKALIKMMKETIRRTRPKGIEEPALGVARAFPDLHVYKSGKITVKKKPRNKLSTYDAQRIALFIRLILIADGDKKLLNTIIEKFLKEKSEISILLGEALQDQLSVLLD